MIVWLASYPRSGNTFMRVLLKACFGLESYSQYNDKTDIGDDPQLSKLVGHKTYEGSWESFYDSTKESNERFIIKTHDAPIDLGKTIYLVRDPRSVVVSFHNYLERFSELDFARKHTILGATAFGSWGQHISAWNPNKRADTLLVRFEELTKNPVLIAQKVSEFLGLEIIDKSIPSFTQLKKVNSKFFSSGSDKRNVSELDSDELNLINFLFRKQMKLMGYEPDEKTNRNDALHSILETSKDIWSLQHSMRAQSIRNSAQLTENRNRLAAEHASEMERVRGEQKKFVGQLINSVQSSGAQAEALAKQSIALTEKFEKTNDQLENLWKQKSELTATVQFLRNVRTQITEENNQLKSNNLELSQDLTVLQNEMTKTADVITKTNEKIENAWKQKSELLAQTESLKSKQVMLLKENDETRSQNDELSSQLANKIEALNMKDQEIADAKARISALEAKQSTQIELAREMELFKEQFMKQEDLNAQLQETGRKLEQLETENTSLETKVRSHNSEKKRLESKIVYRDRVLEETKTDLARVKALNEAHSEEIETLRSNLSEERNRIDGLQNKLTEFSSQRIAREKVVRDLENNLETLREKVLKLSKRNQELSAQYAATKEQFLEMNSAVAPRLKSILTLKPMRYVWNKRQLVKRGNLQIDSQGLPVPNEIENGLPANLERTVRADSDEKPILRKRPSKKSAYSSYKIKKPLGIAVYTYDRMDSVENVLESLLLQDGLVNTHVWIDGDQGNPKKRKLLDEAEKLVRAFPVKQVHRNRGNYGFRKMMIVSMRKMFDMYERVLFLEDDCFPTRHAIKGFSYELDQIENDDSIFSVYGHPFLTEAEKNGPIGRFQGWGWATTRNKLMPIWPSLLNAYLMSEDEYLQYINAELTDEILGHIDVTPGRQPSSTINKFFAWDEVLCFLAGQKGLKHKLAMERLIYNFGVGDGSTHFNNIDHYRKPPFNMVSMNEIWDHF